MTIITDKAMLAKLKIAQWSASKHDRKITNEVADKYAADADMGRYSKRLLAKERLDKIKQVATRARHHHYENTLPWLDDGARILPADNYFDYMQTQNAFQREFEAAVADFKNEYPTALAEAKSKLNGLFDPKDYPDPRRLDDLFSMTVDVDPMPDASDFRVALSDAENARIRDALQGRLDKAVEGAVNDLWSRLHDVVNHMVERLKAYTVDKDGKVSGTFRDSLVGNVRELVELLPKLNVTNNNALNDMAHRLSSELCAFEPAQLREDPKARKDTAKKAEKILKEIADFMS